MITDEILYVGNHIIWKTELRSIWNMPTFLQRLLTQQPTQPFQMTESGFGTPELPIEILDTGNHAQVQYRIWKINFSDQSGS